MLPPLVLLMSCVLVLVAAGVLGKKDIRLSMSSVVSAASVMFIMNMQPGSMGSGMGMSSSYY